MTLTQIELDYISTILNLPLFDMGAKFLDMANTLDIPATLWSISGNHNSFIITTIYFARRRPKVKA